jgi:hypothetical protein
MGSPLWTAQRIQKFARAEQQLLAACCGATVLNGALAASKVVLSLK